MGHPFSKILVIIPAFNEEANIRRTVEEVLQLRKDVGIKTLPEQASERFPVFDGTGNWSDIVVIDDGSRDATASEARRTRSRVISLDFNLGIGGAVQTGLQFGQRLGYDIAVQIDGDGQHDPQFLPDILQPIYLGQADLVIGSRFLPPFLGYRSSFVRRIGINFFARLISLLTGFSITDPTSGFRAFNQKAIRVFSKNYPQDYPEPESIVIARQLGLRVVEVPVKMRKRVAGFSSIRYLRTFYYMVKVTFAILLDLFKNRSKSP